MTHAEKVLIPLSSDAPMENPLPVECKYSYLVEDVWCRGTAQEIRRKRTAHCSHTIRLSRMMCGQGDVVRAKAFLDQLLTGHRPQVWSLKVAVTKPALTPAELRLMGVSESGRNAVEFSDSEDVTFWIVASPVYIVPATVLIRNLARKLPLHPQKALRDLMASAYLRAWKQQPGSWWSTRLPLLSQSGLIDTQLGCLVSLDSDTAALFENAVN